MRHDGGNTLKYQDNREGLRTLPLNPIGDVRIPPIDDTGLSTIAVSVVDDRDRVKKGKPRNFVGVAHGVFGIPFGLYIDPSLAVEDGDKDRDLSQFLHTESSRDSSREVGRLPSLP